MNRTTVLSALALIASAGLLSAGPLNPPAGNIAGTYKTLAEVEPRTAINAANTPGDNDATPSLYKITQPGSYYLAGGIQGVAGKIGIEIASGGVTLDLMGFEFSGVAGSLDGISVTTPVVNVAVVNGSVRAWGSDGIDLGSASNTRVADLCVSANSGMGLVTGNGSSVSACSVYANVHTGLTTGSNASVTNCAAYLNGGEGISLGSSGAVSDCSARDNAALGIFTGYGAVVSNCSSRANGTSGILVGIGSSILNCTAYANTADGIVCSSDCTLRGNNCSLNGPATNGAGIRTTESDNRVEGNNCTDNGRGVSIDLGGNFVCRNTCSGNATNYVVAAGNACYVVNATISAAISGNSGGFSVGSSDPNANFAY